MDVFKDTNNNDDEEVWSTVKSKRNPKRSKRNQRMQVKTPNLAPIYEAVSDDEVYYSSGGSDHELDVVKKAKDKVSDMKSTIIIIKDEDSSRMTDKLQPTSNKISTAKSKQKVTLPQSRSFSPDLCSISKKLDLLADKGIFITRSRRKQVFRHGDEDDRNCQPGCVHCREYQQTVSGFAEYFKHRNSIEKPVLDDLNLQLINNANKWRMDFIRSKTPTPALPQKATNPVSEDNSPVIMSISDTRNEGLSVSDGSNDSMSETDNSESVKIDPLPIGAEVSVREATVVPIKVSNLVPKTIENRTEKKHNKAETCSNMEKNLQDTSLKLQNLYDNLESLRVDSNLYFCKLIDFLDS